MLIGMLKTEQSSLFSHLRPYRVYIRFIDSNRQDIFSFHLKPPTCERKEIFMNKECKIKAKIGGETSIRQNNRILETEKKYRKSYGVFFKQIFRCK